MAETASHYGTGQYLKFLAEQTDEFNRQVSEFARVGCEVQPSNAALKEEIEYLKVETRAVLAAVRGLYQVWKHQNWRTQERVHEPHEGSVGKERRKDSGMARRDV